MARKPPIGPNIVDGTMGHLANSGHVFGGPFNRHQEPTRGHHQYIARETIVESRAVHLQKQLDVDPLST